ncbi:MAG: IclR family transcriptional regulator [Thalassobaculum sp.]
MEHRPVPGAQSFSRSMAVLQLVADHPGAPTVADLMRQADLTRPTLYRILASLEAEGLIRQGADKRYRLGSRLIGLAHSALAQQDIRSLARDALSALRDETGETVHLAVRTRDEMVYIEKVESVELVRMASTVGTRVPFHTSSVGKAFLAALTEAEAEALIDRLDLPAVTGRTVTDPETLRARIAAARRFGYSSDEEENETGIVCFGAAIRDAAGQPVASVSVSVPTFRLKEDRSLYWRPLLARCAAISRQLGG